jgi:hypothetical protein
MTYNLSNYRDPSSGKLNDSYLNGLYDQFQVFTFRTSKHHLVDAVNAYAKATLGKVTKFTESMLKDHDALTDWVLSFGDIHLTKYIPKDHKKFIRKDEAKLGIRYIAKVGHLSYDDDIMLAVATTVKGALLCAVVQQMIQKQRNNDNSKRSLSVVSNSKFKCR